MAKVLISGGTGFVGRHIVDLLTSRGDDVFVLTRDPQKCEALFKNKVTPIKWASYNDQFDCSLLKGLNFVINLVGESLSAKRWTDNQKKEIYNSRVVATNSIFKSLEKENIIVDHFLSTSAIGYYSKGFLKEVCEKWEKAVHDGKASYKKYSILRLGVVLGHESGMIKELAPIFKLSLGGKLGDGNQVLSWIHVKDLSRMFLFCMDKSIEGELNATSRFNVSNKHFSEVFAKLLGAKSRFTVPKFILYILKGEMASMILEDQDISPKKFNKEKFEYFYATIELALKEITSHL